MRAPRPVPRPTNQYLTFHETWPSGRKTAAVRVCNARSGIELGVIRWYGSWRQYVLFPSADTVWNTGCLESVQEYIAALMADRAAAVLAAKRQRGDGDATHTRGDGE